MIRSAILGAALFSLSLGPCDKIKALAGGQQATAEPSDTTTMVPAATVTPEDQLLKEAADLCAAGDCVSAHDRLVVGLPANAPQRQSQTYKDIETKWANATIDGASDDPDLMARRRALGDVIASPTVDPATKARAQQTLAALPTKVVVYDAGPLPKASASAADDGTDPPPAKKPGKKHH